MICHACKEQRCIKLIHAYVALFLYCRVHSLATELPALCLGSSRDDGRGTVYPGRGPSVRRTDGPPGPYFLGKTVRGGPFFPRIGGPGGGTARWGDRKSCDTGTGPQRNCLKELGKSAIESSAIERITFPRFSQYFLDTLDPKPSG